MVMDSEKELAKRLYGQYGFLINRTCLRILGSEDDAHDAVQDVFLKLLKQYASIHDKEKVVPWIFNAAKNHCFNVLRYNKKFIGSRDADETSGDDGFEEKLSTRELIRFVFRNHSKNVRDAVYYTYVEQFDQRDIQKLTGQSPATIRRNLKRFKNSLPSIRKRLEL
jgi:RNA polymerase sigma-70 factor (ECF subfamily)